MTTRKTFTKIIRVYENSKGVTMRAEFNTDGFKEVNYRKDYNWYGESKTEEGFQYMINNEGWKMVSERTEGAQK